MAKKLSLRVRLAFWYSLIVGLTLVTFAFYTYLSVQNGMNLNLDQSLSKVANSLDLIFRKNFDEAEKQRYSRRNNKKVEKEKLPFSLEKEDKYINKLNPDKKPLIEGEASDEDVIWSTVYEHILLNPKNYYIQIADSNNKIIWRSNNLFNDTLPILMPTIDKNTLDSLKKKQVNIDTNLMIHSLKKIDSVYKEIKIDEQPVRLFMKKTDKINISVGYTIEEVQGTLAELLKIILIALPIVLGVSTIGGLILSKLSLRQIDEVIQGAEEITATNLNRRLPEAFTNDEVGHLTKTLNKMIERLEKSFTQIRQFTSDASHELRTPLTILRGELEIALHSEKSVDDYELIVASALEEAERLSNVVETLLDLSRAETGQIKINLIRADISKIVQDIAEDAEVLAEEKKINVESNIEKNVMVNHDPPRIHQAVLNLVDNAVKYTPNNGTVKIELKKTPDFIEIIVSDTGTGIPAEQIPYIFNRFYRVDKARSSNVYGAGLGLSIVHWIVEAHNGTIDVKSEYSKGSAFTLKIPR